jgi:hypothetical protein
MKQLFVPLCLLFLVFNTYGQHEGDSRVSTKVSDTSDLYNKVKRALIKNNYIIKDDMNKTVLTTYTSVKKHLGHTIIKAEISNDTVTIRGFYSNKKWRSIYGYEMEPGRFNKIIYFKGSNGWPLLQTIASEIDNRDLSFSK